MLLEYLDHAPHDVDFGRSTVGPLVSAVLRFFLIRFGAEIGEAFTHGVPDE